MKKIGVAEGVTSDPHDTNNVSEWAIIQLIVEKLL
jgi:hypothetical protein